MKIIAKSFGWLLLVIFLVVFYIFGSFGYIPWLIKAMGSERAKDLGVRYTTADFDGARAKSQLVYLALPGDSPPENSLFRTVSRPITTSWNSSEMTSLLNDRPWKYWPISEVQFRINADGTEEIAGVVNRDKLKGYAAAIGVSPEVATGVVSFLPPNSDFYIKAKTSLENNQVKDFDIQKVSYGKISIPVKLLLSTAKNTFGSSAIAADSVSELSKYSGKRAAIISFINERLGKITGFYAKSANFNNGKLYFDGTLSETEATAR